MSAARRRVWAAMGLRDFRDAVRRGGADRVGVHAMTDSVVVGTECALRQAIQEEEHRAGAAPGDWVVGWLTDDTDLGNAIPRLHLAVEGGGQIGPVAVRHFWRICNDDERVSTPDAPT